MTTIRVDREVYIWIQSLAKPFEDTPNSVLRRVAGLDKNKAEVTMLGTNDSLSTSDHGTKRLDAKRLQQQWGVNAVHVRAHRDGTFYEHLKGFPGALFDANGYIIFPTESDYLTSPYLSIKEKTNVRDKRGISSIPGYRRMR